MEKAGTAYGNDQLTYKTVSRQAKQSENEVSENGTDDTNQQAVDIQFGFTAHKIIPGVTGYQTDDDHAN